MPASTQCPFGKPACGSQLQISFDCCSPKVTEVFCITQLLTPEEILRHRDYSDSGSIISFVFLLSYLLSRFSMRLRCCPASHPDNESARWQARGTWRIGDNTLTVFSSDNASCYVPSFGFGGSNGPWRGHFATPPSEGSVRVRRWSAGRRRYRPGVPYFIRAGWADDVGQVEQPQRVAPYRKGLEEPIVTLQVPMIFDLGSADLLR